MPPAQTGKANLQAQPNRAGTSPVSAQDENRFQQEKVSNEDEIDNRGNRDNDWVRGGNVVRKSGGRTELPGVGARNPETEVSNDKISEADNRAPVAGDSGGAGGGDGVRVERTDVAGAVEPDSLSERLAELGRTPELSASVGKSKSPTPFVLGNSLPELEMPTSPKKNTHVGILQQVKQTQQPTEWAKVDWYRHELDFRPLKKGYTVLLRKRLRWSATRYSKTILTRTCPQLTRKMVEQISVGKFTPAAITALQDGGFADGFIQALQERIGKGNGRRRADLTELERSLLARIESSLVSGGRKRRSDTASG